MRAAQAAIHTSAMQPRIVLPHPRSLLIAMPFLLVSPPGFASFIVLPTASSPPTLKSFFEETMTDEIKAVTYLRMSSDRQEASIDDQRTAGAGGCN